MHEKTLTRGREALQQGDAETARALARDALASNPQDAQALALLGDAEQHSGRLPQALEAWQRVLEAEPDWTLALVRAGSLLAALGRLDEAVAVFRRALQRDPQHVEACYKLGKALQLSGRLDEAVGQLAQLLDSRPEHITGRLDLADALSARNETDRAMEQYRRVLELEPTNVRAVLGVAWLQELEGLYTEALETIGPLANAAATRNAFGITWARLKLRLGDRQAAHARLEMILDDPGCTPDQKMRANFLMGDLLDRQESFDRAFEHYRTANAMKPVRHDPETHRRFVDELIAFFTADRLATLPRASRREPHPVFIIGMPRSGTSLAEQILASHPRVFGGGERLGLYAIERSLEGYPACLAELSRDQLDELADSYRASFGALGGGITTITDKFTTNFLALGLIELLFPGARIVHCRRDLLDTGLSCYFQDFMGEGLAWSYDLEHIGRYIVEYRRLMAHWRGVLSLPVFELDYEELTRSPEQQTRELVAFADLEWDGRCLEFHRQPRIINTASYAQIREPIHRRSVGRYRHYANHLGPLVRVLEAAGIN